MKKLDFIILFFAIITFTYAQGSIVGSFHDFSSAGWNTGDEICQPCHTPHNAITTAEPLWNHEVTTAAFTLYNSSTFDADDQAQPSGTSKLCLSCHDGTVALDSYGGATGTTYITGHANLGTDLSDDHPISFTYDAALATSDGGLFDPTTELSGLGSTITADLLFAEQMQCSSCHDAHDNNFGSFLIMSNTSSALCLTCHNK